MEVTNEMSKKRDLTWNVFFNYCCKADLKYVDDLKRVVENSKETGNILLVKLLGVFEENLPKEEFDVVRKDLYAIANDPKGGDLSSYVTCTPSWDDWTKSDRDLLRNARNYTAGHFSSQIMDILLERAK